MSLPPPQTDQGVVIGIDVGGTKTAFGLVEFPGGNVLMQREMRTPQGVASGASFLAEVCAVAGSVRDEAPAGIAGIGLGLCELVDLDGGVASAHRVHWQGLPVLERLRAVAPAIVEADVRAAALAEARWGAGRDHRDLLYVNIGTGISTCWVKGGLPHAGAHGHALAIASSPMVATCPGCGTQSSYVLEDVAGGAALAKLYGNAVGRNIDSAIDVIAAAATGDPTAQDLIAQAAQLLGVTLGLAVNMLDPEALLIGGGLGGRDGPYWKAIVPAIRRQIWSDQARQLPINRAKLGPDVGLIGAAASWWMRRLQSDNPGGQAPHL